MLERRNHMTKAFSVADIRKELRKAFDRAHFYDEIIKVNKHGDPFVAVVSSEYGESLEQIRLIANSLEIDPHKFLERLIAMIAEHEDIRDEIAAGVEGTNASGTKETTELDTANG